MGVSPQLDEKIGEKLVKTDIVKRIISHAAFKDKRELEKTDGKRSSRVIVPKLDDAIWAGSKRSK